MSAWTNTWVKAKVLPKKIVYYICDDSIHNISCIWYMNKTRSFESILKEWLRMHKEEYDYFVKDCGVPEEHMTKEYLTQDLKNHIEYGNKQLEGLTKVKQGEITLEDYIRDIKLYKGIMTNPRCKYVKNTIWIKMPYEIFRYRYYSDMNFNNGLRTIDDLLRYLKEGNQTSIHDFKEKTRSNQGTGLTSQLKQQIIDYYSQFGDNNFVVYFG